MGKTSQRRATQRQENTGCMWGIICMFYSRRDPKLLLLDRKQGSRRHTFSGFAGRGHSRKKSREFKEIDEDRDNMEECSARKPTVKMLMEGELGKIKQSKKIPNDEVLRILADLGHDVCLDKSSMQNSKQKGVKNHNASIHVASPSGSLDPSGSKCMKQEEDDLEIALSDFLEPHDNCRNNSELCPELKSLIHTKLNEFNSPPCDLAYEQTPESESHVGTKSEPRKMLEKTNIFEDSKNSNQHELAIKTHSKESRNIFFWKKDKSSRRQTSEGSSQPVNKIVILKPNPRRGLDPTIATTSKFLHKQSCTIQAPENSATECSRSSVKEVRRRFRIVTGETRKGRPSVNEDDLQRDSCWPGDSVFTIKKESRQIPEQSSGQRASATAKNHIRPVNSSRQKQMNEGLGRINSNTNASKDASIFYKVARKHLAEILNDRSKTTYYPSPTVQMERSLVGMLALSQCSTSSSPRSSPRVKECIELSPEEKSICHKVERESAKERSKSEEDPCTFACGTSEALDEQADQERHLIRESTQHGDELDIACIEEIEKPDCSEKIYNVQCTPAEQHRYNSPLEMMQGVGKEHDEMLPFSPRKVVEKQEQKPITPRLSASLELISQIPAEECHEKHEQPSPISVLDPFFHADADSPDNENMIKCEWHQNVLRPQYYPDAGSDQGIFWEDKVVRLGYIKAVLELSELCTNQNFEVWYLEEELISPCLFEELHEVNQTDGLKLFFDCVCEAITVIQGTHFRNRPCLSFVRHNIQAPPRGRILISEINKHIEGHLCYQFPSTLKQLINMDLQDGTWINLRSESEEIVVDIWEFLLDELLEDVAYDLWI